MLSPAGEWSGGKDQQGPEGLLGNIGGSASKGLGSDASICASWAKYVNTHTYTCICLCMFTYVIIGELTPAGAHS